MLKVRICLLVFFATLLGCSMRSSTLQSTVRFGASAVAGATDFSSVTASEFSRLSQYPWACISIIQQDRRLVYGSSIEEVNRASDQLFVEFRTPPLAVNRTYTVRILGFTDEPEDSFSCPASDPAGILWAQLGRVEYQVGAKPGELKIPAVFYETLASVSINNGATHTNSSAVSLKLACRDATKMTIYHSDDCTGNAISGFDAMDFQSAISGVNLVPSTGNFYANLSVKFTGAGDNELACVADGIQLDTEAPQVASVAKPNKFRAVPFTLGIDFDEPISNFTSASLGLTTNITRVSVSGSGKQYQLTLTPTGAGAVSLGLDPSFAPKDTAGNPVLSLNYLSTSITVSIDNTPPAGSFSIASPSSLDLTSISDAVEMYITNTAGCASGGTWEPFSSAKNWTPTFSSGSATVWAKFRDDVGNESCLSASYTAPNPTLVPPSMTINTGQPFSSSLTVPLDIQWGGYDQVCLSLQNPEPSPCGPLYNSSTLPATYTFTGAQSVQTLHAYFKKTGATTVHLGASVIYDHEAPTSGSLQIKGGAVAAFTQTENLTNITATDTNGPIKMYVTNVPGCGSGGVWENLASSKQSWPLAQTDAVATVYYKFKDAANNETTCLSASIKQCNHVLCGESASNSCYTGLNPTELTACVSSGDVIELTQTPSGFGVWKKRGEDKILKPSGLWSPGTTDGWQKKLNPDGKSFSSSYFTDWQTIQGIAHPPNVYLSDSDKFATNKWFYYTEKFATQKVGEDSVSNPKQPWVDYLDGWRDASWFKGNIRTCNLLGMRLPTLYELNVAKPDNSLPSGTPTFPGTNGNGVPNPGAIWTATTYRAGTPACYWLGAKANNFPYGCVAGGVTSHRVRCVLPES